MTNERKPGTGAMFRNDKQGNDKRPDYRGSLTLLDGTECWISGWVNKPDGKDPYMAIKIEVKQPKPAEAEPAPATVVQNDLPF